MCFTMITILKHTVAAADYRYQLVSLDISIPRLLNTRHNVFQYGTRYENRTRLSALKGQRPNR